FFLPRAIDRISRALNTPGIQLRARDDEHDFAFRRMRFIVCQQFGSIAATKFLKFFCQLTRNAQLPIRHDRTASLKCFNKPVGRFKKKRRLLAFSCHPQFALASAAFHRKKSTERESLGGKSGTNQSREDGRWTGHNRKRQFTIDAFANKAQSWIGKTRHASVCYQGNVVASGKALDQLSRTRRFIVFVVADKGLFDLEMF